MSDAKTRPTGENVQAFIDGVAHKTRKADAQKLLAMMQEITGEEPTMWGPSIIGFGSYHYVYESGREGDWPLVGFSPRKSSLSLYLNPSADGYDKLLDKLGKHKQAVGCLYINKLADVDEDVLREIIALSYQSTKAQWPKS